MKILVLGGAGDMGRMVVAALLSAPQVTAVTIADKNYALAQKIVEITGSKKLMAVELDITDEEKLYDFMCSYDLIVNTVGPFYKFGVPILKTAIKAERNYLDICDDWKPTIEMLKLDEEAKAAGITAIIGIGASPGITNLMAVKACSELDEVEEIITGWGLGSTKSGKKPQFFIGRKKLFDKSKKEEKQANAALLHLIYEGIGKIPTFRDGQLIEIEALSEIQSFKFPAGGKAIYACHIGHPEPVTLSRTLKARSISNVMYLTKYITNQLREYLRRIEAQEMAETDVALAIERILNKWWINIYLFFWLLSRFFKLPPELCVLATGKKENKLKKVAIGLRYRPYGEAEEGMDGVTSIPLAVATLMVIDGKITKTGVLTPEEAIEPNEFFERYAKYCKEGLIAKDVLIEKIIDLE